MIRCWYIIVIVFNMNMYVDFVVICCKVIDNVIWVGDSYIIIVLNISCSYRVYIRFS